MTHMVLFSEEFRTWLSARPTTVKVRIEAATLILREFGPALGRPLVDTLKSSRVSNLKELRVSVGRSAYRILFAFDPKRQVYFMCGGDKAGNKRFYKTIIPHAEAIYRAHLQELKQSPPAREEDSQ